MRVSDSMVVTAVVVLQSLVVATTSAQEPAEESAIETKADDMLPPLKFAIDDEDPASKVPSKDEANKSPLDMGYWVMAVSDRAEAAQKRGDYAHAAKYFMALTVAAPDQALVFSKLCRNLQAAGDIPAALEACKAAVSKLGATVEDHARVVRLLLSQPGPLAEGDVKDIEAIAGHLETAIPEGKGRVLANQLRCETALRLEDTVRLTACTTALDKLGANDASTIAFTWALAVKNNDWQAAGRVIERAKLAHLPAAAIAQMEQGMRAERERPPAWLAAFRGWKLIALLAASALAAVAFTLRSQRRTRTA